MRIWTVGHGTRRIEEFTAILHDAAITHLVDVRTFPGSRRHPQFGQAALRASLADMGVGYLHLPGLGGRRDPQPDSPHTALRVAAFRGYADHMTSDAFRRDVASLVALARGAPTAYMCAETLWWRCHRRILSDLVAAHGWVVVHLTAPGKSEAHRMWDVARVAGDTVIYDVGTLPLKTR